jgi:hypothetical protein
MPLTHRPIEEKDIPVVCGFPQSEDELFFMFPKASYPLSPTVAGLNCSAVGFNSGGA